MDPKRVKDLMVPLDEYAVVSRDATLLEAVRALEKAQKAIPAGRQPHRAVLVLDENGRIVGKVGQLAVLRALEPRYNVVGDLESLARAGVSDQFVSSMMEHYRFFQDHLTGLCSRAATRSVREVMVPATESVDENVLLSEAIHRVIMWQSLSVLVTRGTDVVGVLRLSDLFDEITAQMEASAS
jgi:predicted transcriptional regulator